MGFLDDSMSVISGRSRHHHSSSKRRSSHKKKRSRSRSRSSSRGRGGGLGSIFGDNHYKNFSSSRASFFNLGHDRNGSRSSFFGLGGKPSSYYKRSSRQGFMQRSFKQLKRLLRDLVHWAKRHPYKVFFLVLMPLISGGVLTALLARFGLRLPHSLERLLGMASKAATGDTSGLVGEAVRMASGGGAAAGSASVSARSFHQEDPMSYGSYNGGGGGGGSNEGWGESVTRGIGKMFL